ncbi:MAG: hypothetical protein ABI461_09575 [Polyangiaceae bacterium]
MSGRALLVRIDGELLPEKDSRDLWARFSTHMDEHQGDLGGFAKKEGLASIRPSIEQGAPILLGSHTEAQTPYRTVTAEPASEASSKSAQPKQNRPGGAKGSNAGSGKNQSGANSRPKKR